MSSTNQSQSPIRYRMEEKLWTLRNRYAIRSPEGEELFSIEGKLLSMGHKLTFSNWDSEILARIEQKLWSWRATYFIDRFNAPRVRVRKMHLPLFKSRFEIETPGEPTIEATGNIWGYEFEFHRGPTLIATVSKKLFSWTDSYGIEIEQSEDQVLLLAATVIIDLVSHGHGDGSAA